MASSPDLFVVCRNCGSEVSPYITECPYCGTRLRKRAPKIERDGTVSEPKPKNERRRGRRGRAERSAGGAPRLSRLRAGELPGVGAGTRPWATGTLVLLSLIGYLVLIAVNRGDVAVAGPIEGEWWRVATSPFLYGNVWYELACVVAIAVFGWRLEVRHGPLVVLMLFALCGMGGAAVVVLADDTPVAIGANGAALGLLAAWAVPDVQARRRHEDYDGDLLGALVIAVVLLLMPLAVTEASALAGVTGLLIGFLLGLPLARRA